MLCYLPVKRLTFNLDVDITNDHLRNNEIPLEYNKVVYSTGLDFVGNVEVVDCEDVYIFHHDYSVIVFNDATSVQVFTDFTFYTVFNFFAHCLDTTTDGDNLFTTVAAVDIATGFADHIYSISLVDYDENLSVICKAE